jgi:hypothetical protein
MKPVTKQVWNQPIDLLLNQISTSTEVWNQGWSQIWVQVNSQVVSQAAINVWNKARTKQ